MDEWPTVEIEAFDSFRWCACSGTGVLIKSSVPVRVRMLRGGTGGATGPGDLKGAGPLDVAAELRLV